jgi:hypothetical protein
MGTPKPHAHESFAQGTHELAKATYEPSLVEVLGLGR